ncbi:pirin family protein [Rhizobacter sp. LjRoot28]|uniref:pirin family protein n=1 Tax=Rhizobacter sp. LjRoot28 TaxID=3342309 RepID=UPI003ECE3A2E
MGDAADLVFLKPHTKTLSPGFTVRRTLPAVQRQAVGPFLFFDHFGPVEAGPADDHDVRPHPHIGLATVTYLFEGAMMHRDSTGVVQRIEPGAINWMTAGRGIVHSERTPDDLRAVTRRSHGLQLWAALPAEHEEDPPAFSHTGADAIPGVTQDGATLRILVGAAFGERSPVPTLSPALYVDMALSPSATLTVPDAAPERALYGIDQAFLLDGTRIEPQQMVVLPPGATPTLTAPDGARLVLIGGEPLGHRHMWWNFVSTRKDRIAQAADEWAAQRMGQVHGETEFIEAPVFRPR